MNLTKAQKKYIKKFRKQQSTSQIASHFGISEIYVKKYIQETWEKKDMLHKIFSISNTRQASIRKIYIHELIRKKYKYFFLFAIAVICIYVNALPNDFVSDDLQLLTIPHWSFYDVFTRQVSFLRQIVYFTLYHIGGMHPYVFRFSSILFHIGTVTSIYILLLLLTDETVALFTALLFAVHPLLTESVTWVAGGAYTQYTFFFLLALLLFLQSFRSNKLFYLSLVSYFLAILSSEKTVVLFLLFWIAAYIFDSISAQRKKLLFYTGISILTSVLYIGQLGKRVDFLNSSSSGAVTFLNPFQQVPIAIFSYITLIIWPQNLSFYHDLIFSETAYIKQI